MADKAQARALLRACYRRLLEIQQRMDWLDSGFQGLALGARDYDLARIECEQHMARLHNAIFEACGNPARVRAWSHWERTRARVLPSQLGARIESWEAFWHIHNTEEMVIGVMGRTVGQVTTADRDHLERAREQISHTKPGPIFHTDICNTAPPPAPDPDLELPELPYIYSFGNAQCTGPGFAIVDGDELLSER